MIQAYISIGLKSGMKVQYVRDKVEDTYGKDGQYYGYEGRAYQDLESTPVRTTPMVPLSYGGTYSFKLTIDGGSQKEYTIKIPEYESRIFDISKERGVFSATLAKELNHATNADGAEWVSSNRFDFRCRSLSLDKDAKIDLDPGTTNDLFAAMGVTIKDPVHSDLLVDQNTKAGQVLHDYNQIIKCIKGETIGAAEVFLEFPESTSTTQLKRKNNNDPESGTAMIITQIPINAITEVSIVEKTIYR